jgi:hypothetical protein
VSNGPGRLLRVADDDHLRRAIVAVSGGELAPGPGAGPLQARAGEEFAGHVATGTAPSIRVIRARLHVGPVRSPRR